MCCGLQQASIFPETLTKSDLLTIEPDTAFSAIYAPAMPITIFNTIDVRWFKAQRCTNIKPIKLTLKSNYPLQCILRLDLFRCKTWFNDNRGYRHNRWSKLPTLFTFRYLQENATGNYGALQLKHTLNHFSMESILKSCISLPFIIWGES